MVKAVKLWYEENMQFYRTGEKMSDHESENRKSLFNPVTQIDICFKYVTLYELV